MFKSLICDKSPYNKKENYIDKNDHIDIVYKNSDKLYSTTSKYQKIEVFKNKFFGNILAIDDDIQLTEHDEENYHEMLAHVPLNYLPHAKNVLIIGGGDGGTAREVAKHKNLKEIIVVDIDKQVIEVCKEYFPKLAEGFKSSKVKLEIDDGAKWVNKHLNDKKNHFDVILIDSTDYNTAKTLFTGEFYENIKSLLKKEGIFCFNCLSISWEKEEMPDVIEDMRELYKYVRFYQVFQPTYASGHYAFCFCSRTINPKNTPIDWSLYHKKNIMCQYYNKNIHYDSFNLPNQYFLKNIKTQRLGTNFLITLSGCPQQLLSSKEILREMINFMMKVYHLKPLNLTSKKKNDGGYVFMVLFEKSYLALSTWPSLEKATVDYFNNDTFVYDIAVSKKKINLRTIIKFYLKPSKIKFKSVEREI